MKYRSKVLASIIRALPGERFGNWIFVPIGFGIGAAIEWCMINWRPRGVNFYDVYRVKHLEKEALHQIATEDFLVKLKKDFEEKKQLKNCSTKE